MDEMEKKERKGSNERNGINESNGSNRRTKRSHPCKKINTLRNTANKYANIVETNASNIFYCRQGRSLDRQITTQDIDCLRV